MLRSYGWRIIPSLPLRLLRRVSTILKSTSLKEPSIRNIGKIEGSSLAEIQAALESSSYRGHRKARGKVAIEDTVLLKAAREATIQTAVPFKSTRKTTAKSTTTDAAVIPASRRTRRRRACKNTSAIPPRLQPPTVQKHHDLPSFLAYAERSNLNKTSNVYKGTHYEYTVAAALDSYNFILQRTGRRNDLGIDLVGHWRLPGNNNNMTEAVGSGMPVLIQCKFAKPTPSMIRELEGTYVGAPAGWNGPNVLALLVSTHQATEGVRAAVQRSKWPLGVVQVTRSGVTRGFLWNAVAGDAGLQGLNVGVRYDAHPDASSPDQKDVNVIKQSIMLSWMDRPWRPVVLEKQQNRVEAAAESIEASDIQLQAAPRAG